MQSVMSRHVDLILIPSYAVDSDTVSQQLEEWLVNVGDAPPPQPQRWRPLHILTWPKVEFTIRVSTWSVLEWKSEGLKLVFYCVLLSVFSL